MWRDAAKNAAASLAKGSRVVASGVLKPRTYETKAGEERTVIELEVEEIGLSLKFTAAAATRAQRMNQQAPPTRALATRPTGSASAPASTPTMTRGSGRTRTLTGASPSLAQPQNQHGKDRQGDAVRKRRMPVPKKTKTVTPYFTEGDADQIRAAVNAVGHLEGYASITELVEAATLRELRRLQRKYNGGRKWPGIPAGQMRPGRRTREESQHRKEDGRPRLSSS